MEANHEQNIHYMADRKVTKHVYKVDSNLTREFQFFNSPSRNWQECHFALCRCKRARDNEAHSQNEEKDVKKGPNMRLGFSIIKQVFGSQADDLSKEG